MIPFTCGPTWVEAIASFAGTMIVVAAAAAVAIRLCERWMLRRFV